MPIATARIFAVLLQLCTLKWKVCGGVSRHAIALHVKMTGTLGFQVSDIETSRNFIFYTFKLDACLHHFSRFHLRLSRINTSHHGRSVRIPQHNVRRYHK